MPVKNRDRQDGRSDDNRALTVPLPQPEQLQAAATADAEAAVAFARNYANGLYADEIEAAKGEASRAEFQVQSAQQGLDICRSELSRAPKWQHFLHEWADYGHRQPVMQRLYNTVRIPVALAGPAVGGGFLVANMMDTSFAMAESPYLALLAAGLIGVGSIGMSSWATAPTTDFKKTEARANLLSVLGIFAFALWAAFMAIKFGAAPGGASASLSFNVASGSGGFTQIGRRALEWLHGSGASILALGLHVFGDAMISAGILSSSICAMRKTRRIKTEYTQHHTLLSREYTGWSERLDAAFEAKTRADARVKAAYAKRDAARELTLQVIQSKKAVNAARRESAIAAVHAEMQGE